MIFLVIPSVYAPIFTWNADTGFNNDFYNISSYWVANGYWDVKGFQWGDSDTTYPTDFSYNWQNGVLSIWVKDAEGEFLPEGTTVGTARQGSVWDQNAPWYDYPPTYQPTALHFAGKSSVTLTSVVRKDFGSRYSFGWMNWLFNPWFSVMSTWCHVTRERKMVWDIVWAYDDYLGFSRAHDYIDGAENLHIAFFASEMAQNGEWKTYTFDLISMAYEAQRRAILMGGPNSDGWQFSVQDLYMWSFDALVEGYNYDSQFSVDYLKVEYTTPSSPPPPGGGAGCPFVSVWDGSQYVLDNSLLPTSVLSNGTDVEDYYKLEQAPVPSQGKYSFLISEFQREHSFIDQVKLLAVDHESDVDIAVTPDGEILTYKNPVAPLSAVDDNGFDRLSEIRLMDGNESDPATYFYGVPSDYLILNFGQVNSDNAKLILRSDHYKKEQECVWVQVNNGSGTWQTVETLVPRAFWSIEAVNLSPYLITGQDLLIRLFWGSPHKLDYVGLDTTKQADYQVHTANLVSATHSTQSNVKSQLLESDNLYTELIPDEQIQLEFTLPNNTKQARTYIFYTNGHYHTITQ